jgi:hypothetical protein
MNHQNQSPLTQNPASRTIADFLDDNIMRAEMQSKMQLRNVCFIESANSVRLLLLKLSDNKTLSAKRLSDMMDDMRLLTMANWLVCDAINMSENRSVNVDEMSETYLKIANSLDAMSTANKKHNLPALTAYKILGFVLSLSLIASILGLSMMGLSGAGTIPKNPENDLLRVSLMESGKWTAISGGAISISLVLIGALAHVLNKNHHWYINIDDDVNYQSRTSTLFAVRKMAVYADVKLRDRVVELKIDGGNREVELAEKEANVVDQSASAALLTR